MRFKTGNGRMKLWKQKIFPGAWELVSLLDCVQNVLCRGSKGYLRLKKTSLSVYFKQPYIDLELIIWCTEIWPHLPIFLFTWNGPFPSSHPSKLSLSPAHLPRKSAFTFPACRDLLLLCPPGSPQMVFIAYSLQLKCELLREGVRLFNGSSASPEPPGIQQSNESISESQSYFYIQSVTNANSGRDSLDVYFSGREKLRDSELFCSK